VRKAAFRVPFTAVCRTWARPVFFFFPKSAIFDGPVDRALGDASHILRLVSQSIRRILL